MIGEQYKIKGMAQAETIRHKRDLWTFIERSLRIKKDSFGHFVKTVWLLVDQVMLEEKCTPRYLTVWSRDKASL